jgi:hypothetical protein
MPWGRQKIIPHSAMRCKVGPAQGCRCTGSQLRFCSSITCQSRHSHKHSATSPTALLPNGHKRFDLWFDHRLSDLISQQLNKQKDPPNQTLSLFTQQKPDPIIHPVQNSNGQTMREIPWGNTFRLSHTHTLY